jgi:hypothetical protein
VTAVSAVDDTTPEDFDARLARVQEQIEECRAMLGKLCEILEQRRSQDSPC